MIKKIGLLISTKIPFDQMDRMCNVIYSLYINHAHLWPLLYSFRLWILQFHHLPTDPNHSQQLDSVT